MGKFKNYMKQFHPIVWVLLTGTILSSGSAFMTLPFLSIYLSKHLALSPLMIGVTVGISPLAQTVGGFIGGYLSDRFGRKIVMNVSLFAIALVYFGFAMAKSEGWFILLNGLVGLCNSFFEPTSQALMADVTEKKNRMKAYSLRYTAINIGASVGPLVGAYLAVTSAKLSFFITGGVYLLYAFVMVYFMKKLVITQPKQSSKHNVTFMESLSILKTDKALLYLVLGIILVNIGYAQISSNVPQVLEDNLSNGVVIFSTLLTVNAVMVVILQMPISHFAEKFTPMQGMMAGAIFMAAGLLLFSFVNGWIIAVLAMLFMTLGEILIFPANSMMIDRLAPEHIRGTYFGAGSFRKIGNFLGPIVGGFLLGRFSGEMMFWATAVITIASIFFFQIGNQCYEKKISIASEKAI